MVTKPPLAGTAMAEDEIADVMLEPPEGTTATVVP